MTVTAGNGHNAAANAMKNRLQNEKDNFEVKVVDIIKEFSNKLNSWLVDGGYAFSVGHLRPIYNMFYDTYMKWPTKKAPICPVQFSVNDISGKLLQLIYDFKPDVIYATSYYCGMALANLRRMYKIPSVNIGCMLDYVVSPFWEASVGGLDYMTVSNEQFKQTLIEKGFKPSQLVVTGIPVDQKFVEKLGKTVARERLGLQKDLFTVLILYGGGAWHGGYEILKNILKNIQTKIQIVIINGRDEKTKAKIDKNIKKYPKNFSIQNVGFSKEVDLYMSACDIMIGKGGGLCTTESINKAIPLLATEKLPSQEVYNIRFLTEKDLAQSFKTKRQMIAKLKYLMDNPKVVDDMHNGLEKLKHNGIEEIAELIISQPKADYSDIETNIEFYKVDKLVRKARKKTYKISKHTRK